MSSSLQSFESSAAGAESFLNVEVTRGEAIQVFQWLFFPWFSNSEVVSHPLHAWKNVSPEQMSAPNNRAISGIARNLLFFPTQDLIHSSDRFSLLRKWTATTITSLSTVEIIANFGPLMEAWLQWRNILASASSWFEGFKGPISNDDVLAECNGIH